jgi:hypothetical protein
VKLHGFQLKISFRSSLSTPCCLHDHPAFPVSPTCPPVAHVHPPFGGKQVLSQRMGHVEGEEGIVLAAAAMHFLKHSDQRRLEPVRIIKSLAFQLAKR